MKILFLTSSLAYGGSERQLVNLAKGLQRAGHEVAVACFRAGALEVDLMQASIPVYKLNLIRRRDVFGLGLRLLRLLQHEQPDILHGYLRVADVWCGLLKPLFPRVKMVWGIRSSNEPLYKYGRLTPAIFQLARRLSPLADLIIYNSCAGRRDYSQKGFADYRGIVIHNGIDINQFRFNPDSRASVRAEWKIDPNVILIGLVARLDVMKDHPTFLQAASLLAAHRSDVYFVCVGDGPADYRNALHAKADALNLGNRLIWAGERTDAPAVQAALDIATLTSIGEGFPNVVAEAMACGVPCVVTDVGDSALIIGDTGIVVPPGNPQALADGWRAMIERIQKLEDKTRLSAAVRTRIVEEFSQTRLTQRTIEALQTLLER